MKEWVSQVFTELKSQAQIFNVFADARIEITRDSSDQVHPDLMQASFKAWLLDMISAEENYFETPPDGFTVSRPFEIRMALMSRYIRRWSHEGIGYVRRHAADGNLYKAFYRVKLLAPADAKMDRIQCIEKLLKGLLVKLRATGME